MTTDTSERGLERLICTALAGHPCEPPATGTVAEPPADYGGVGWSGDNFHGCATELIQQAIGREQGECSMIELGGPGTEDQENLITETA